MNPWISNWVVGGVSEFFTAAKKSSGNSFAVNFNMDFMISSP